MRASPGVNHVSSSESEPGLQSPCIGTMYARAMACWRSSYQPAPGVGKYSDTVNGAMHGGSLYSMADTIGGVAACMSGFYVVTVSGSMNYLKPAVNTEYVTCEANCVREGRELAVYDLRILNDHGDILENGSFTYFHLNEKVK